MIYSSRTLKSSNKNETTWDIIKLETGKNFSNKIFKYWISKGNLLMINNLLQMPSIIFFL